MCARACARAFRPPCAESPPPPRAHPGRPRPAPPPRDFTTSDHERCEIVVSAHCSVRCASDRVHR
eukprot:930014-Alexandrium_andersonii.AAC.1